MSSTASRRHIHAFTAGVPPRPRSSTTVRRSVGRRGEGWQTPVRAAFVESRETEPSAVRRSIRRRGRTLDVLEPLPNSGKPRLRFAVCSAPSPSHLLCTVTRCHACDGRNMQSDMAAYPMRERDRILAHIHDTSSCRAALGTESVANSGLPAPGPQKLLSRSDRAKLFAAPLVEPT